MKEILEKSNFVFPPTCGSNWLLTKLCSQNRRNASADCNATATSDKTQKTWRGRKLKFSEHVFPGLTKLGFSKQTECVSWYPLACLQTGFPGFMSSPLDKRRMVNRYQQSILGRFTMKWKNRKTQNKVFYNGWFISFFLLFSIRIIVDCFGWRCYINDLSTSVLIVHKCHSISSNPRMMKCKTSSSF